MALARKTLLEQIVNKPYIYQVEKFWSLFDCLSERKRSFLFGALMLAVAGMLWQTNDLIDENPHHPMLSPEAGITTSRFDEFGEPVALAKRPAPLPYAKIWSSPVTRIALSFFLALLVGSLFRSLAKGSVTLAVILLLISLLLGREMIFSFFQQHYDPDLFNSAKSWIVDQSGTAKSFIWNSLPSTSAATVGLIMGLLK